jgi:alpha-tubulin suppressor-like RCC1 family protein
VQNSPTQVSYFAERRIHILQIATGEAHTVVLDNLGQVYTFGWGELGQLGVVDQLGKSDAERKINSIEIFKTNKVKKVAAGSISSIALTETGQLYVWGSQQNG